MTAASARAGDDESARAAGPAVAERPGTGLGRRIQAGFSWTLLARVAATAASVASAILLARVLGPAQYGLLPSATSILTLFVLFADVGVSTSVSRHVAVAYYRDPRAIPRLLARGLALKAGLVLGLGGAMALFSGPIADAMGDAALRPVLLVAAAQLAGDGLAQFGFRAFQGLHRAGHLAFASAISGVLSPVLAGAAAIAGLGAAGAIGGRGLGALVAAGYALAVVGRLAREAATGAPTEVAPAEAGTGSILRYGLALFVVHASWFVLFRADVLVVQAFCGTRDVSFYSVPFTAVEKAMLPALSLATVIAPYFAGACDAARRPELRRVLGRAARWTLLAYTPLAVALAILAGPLVSLLFGPDYAPAARILRYYAPLTVAIALANVFGSVLDYLGLARRRAAIFALFAALDLGLNLVLVPRYGPIGAVASAWAAIPPLAVAYVAIARRELRGGPGAPRG